MRIGISINGVLRNYFKQIETVHDKYFPPADVTNEDGSTTEVEGITVLDYDLDKWVTFPKEEVKQGEVEFNPDFAFDFDTDDVDEILDVEITDKDEEVTVEEFLYEKCTLEIFGSADEMVPHAMEALNNLILEYPQHEFIVMSREIGLSVPSTYFFLSKTSCMCQNVQFVTDSRDHWKYVDMMVTDHPDVINAKPNDKTCVVVNKSFNKKDTQTNIRVESIKELGDVLESHEEPVQSQ